MKLIILAVTVLLTQQIPKHNPNGIWLAQSGSEYEIRLTGSDLRVRMVPGSNPKFLRYELDMKNLEEVNTYRGTGFLVAKMNNGKECKLTTEWQFVVVSNDRIIGSGENIVADQETCAVREKTPIQLDLKRKK